MRTLLLCGAVVGVLTAAGTPAVAADEAATGKSGMNSANSTPLSREPATKHSSDASAGKGGDKTAPTKSDVGPVKWMAPEATSKDRMSGAQTNPLYQESDSKGENPLHETK